MSDLASFRHRVRELYRTIPHPTEDRHQTLQDLADAVGLTATELSRRLNGKGKVMLSPANVHAIVRQLVQWQALQSQAEVGELLGLVDCPPFSTQAWQNPPLSQLAPLGPALAAAQDLPAHNLPAPISSFIGRSLDKARVVSLLQTTRLLTITGPGGIGKTRLALEVAREVIGRYPQGAWLVKLAPLTDPAQVIPAIAQQVGCRKEGGRPLEDTLSDYLRPRQLLLVLDNCEHLRAVCAEVAQMLLNSCPHLTIMITSREAFGIAGEVDWPLNPLTTPIPGPVPPTELAKYEAVALFVNRASSARPSFSLSAKNAAPVAEICHRLEGVPLALELAAALVKVMSLTRLATRLGEHLQWLTSSDATAPARQRSLEAAIEWSYNLLSESAQRLLRRLSVFAEGWTLEAAEVLCADERMAEAVVWAAHVELVNKSLVVVEEQAEGDHYHMLELIREYANERLTASGEEQELRLRHAMLYLTLAEQAAPEQLGPEPAEWVKRFEREQGNLRAALTWVLSHDTELAARFACALLWFWRSRGYMSEGRKFLNLILSRLGDTGPIWRAKILNGASALAYFQGDYQVAIELNVRRLALEQELGNQQGIAYSLATLGRVARAVQDYEGAHKLLEESLAIYRQLGDQQGIAHTLADVGDNTYYQRDYEAAQRLYEESLAISKELGSRWGIAYALLGLGDSAWVRGDFEAAEKLLVESLSMFYELGDKLLAAYVLFTLGRVALDEGGEPGAERAVRLCSAGAALFASMDVKPEPAEAAKRDQTLEACRHLLSVAMFEAAWQEGAEMTMAEVIGYVVTQVSHLVNPVQ